MAKGGRGAPRALVQRLLARGPSCRAAEGWIGRVCRRWLATPLVGRHRLAALIGHGVALGEVPFLATAQDPTSEADAGKRRLKTG